MDPFDKLIRTIIFVLACFACLGGIRSDFPLASCQSGSCFAADETATDVPLKRQQSQALFAAGIQAEREGRLVEAEQAYRRCLQFSRENQLKEPQFPTLHRLAVLKAKAGQFDDSEKYFREALPECGENVPFLCDFAKLQMDRKRYGDAETILKNIVLFAPNDRRSLYNLGYAIAMQADRQSEGLRYLKLALGEKEAYRELAKIYRLQGNSNQAEFAEQRAQIAEAGAPGEVSPEFRDHIKQELIRQESAELARELETEMNVQKPIVPTPAVARIAKPGGPVRPLPADDGLTSETSRRSILPPTGIAIHGSMPQTTETAKDPFLAAVDTSVSNRPKGTVKNLPADKPVEKQAVSDSTTLTLRTLPGSEGVTRPIDVVAPSPPAPALTADPFLAFQEASQAVTVHQGDSPPFPFANDPEANRAFPPPVVTKESGPVAKDGLAIQTPEQSHRKSVSGAQAPSISLVSPLERPASNVLRTALEPSSEVTRRQEIIANERRTVNLESTAPVTTDVRSLAAVPRESQNRSAPGIVHQDDPWEKTSARISYGTSPVHKLEFVQATEKEQSKPATASQPMLAFRPNGTDAPPVHSDLGETIPGPEKVQTPTFTRQPAETAFQPTFTFHRDETAMAAPDSERPLQRLLKAAPRPEIIQKQEVPRISSDVAVLKSPLTVVAEPVSRPPAPRPELVLAPKQATPDRNGAETPASPPKPVDQPVAAAKTPASPTPKPVPEPIMVARPIIEEKREPVQTPSVAPSLPASPVLETARETPPNKDAVAWSKPGSRPAPMPIETPAEPLGTRPRESQPPEIVQYAEPTRPSVAWSQPLVLQGPAQTPSTQIQNRADDVAMTKPSIPDRKFEQVPVVEQNQEVARKVFVPQLAAPAPEPVIASPKPLVAENPKPAVVESPKPVVAAIPVPQRKIEVEPKSADDPREKIAASPVFPEIVRPPTPEPKPPLQPARPQIPNNIVRSVPSPEKPVAAPKPEPVVTQDKTDMSFVAKNKVADPPVIQPEARRPAPVEASLESPKTETAQNAPPVRVTPPALMETPRTPMPQVAQTTSAKPAEIFVAKRDEPAGQSGTFEQVRNSPEGIGLENTVPGGNGTFQSHSAPNPRQDIALGLGRLQTENAQPATNFSGREFTSQAEFDRTLDRIRRFDATPQTDSAGFARTSKGALDASEWEKILGESDSKKDASDTEGFARSGQYSK